MDLNFEEEEAALDWLTRGVYTGRPTAVHITAAVCFRKHPRRRSATRKGFRSQWSPEVSPPRGRLFAELIKMINVAAQRPRSTLFF